MKHLKTQWGWKTVFACLAIAMMTLLAASAGVAGAYVEPKHSTDTNGLWRYVVDNSSPAGAEAETDAHGWWWYIPDNSSAAEAEPRQLCRSNIARTMTSLLFSFVNATSN